MANNFRAFVVLVYSWTHAQPVSPGRDTLIIIFACIETFLNPKFHDTVTENVPNKVPPMHARQFILCVW